MAEDFRGKCIFYVLETEGHALVCDNSGSTYIIFLLFSKIEHTHVYILIENRIRPMEFEREIK